MEKETPRGKAVGAPGGVTVARPGCPDKFGCLGCDAIGMIREDRESGIRNQVRNRGEMGGYEGCVGKQARSTAMLKVRVPLPILLLLHAAVRHPHFIRPHALTNAFFLHSLPWAHPHRACRITPRLLSVGSDEARLRLAMMG